MDYGAWWKADALKNVQAGADDWPRIPDVVEKVAARIPRGPSVLDYGCGRGRLAPLFSPDVYLGVDLNPDAADLARERNPDHVFRLVAFLEPLPPAAVVFAHSVLFHVADEDLAAVVDQLAGAARASIVIAEIMDPRWRGGFPFFSRARSDYEDLLEARGFLCRAPETIPHPRYVGGEGSHLVTVLVSDRGE